MNTVNVPEGAMWVSADEAGKFYRLHDDGRLHCWYSTSPEIGWTTSAFTLSHMQRPEIALPIAKPQEPAIAATPRADTAADRDAAGIAAAQREADALAYFNPPPVARSVPASGLCVVAPLMARAWGAVL